MNYKQLGKCLTTQELLHHDPSILIRYSVLTMQIGICGFVTLFLVKYYKLINSNNRNGLI